jgi:hypothetical protein
MNRKRRLLQMSSTTATKKSLDYGSDGQSDDRSNSSSPMENVPEAAVKFMPSSPGSGSLDDDDQVLTLPKHSFFQFLHVFVRFSHKYM